jgi:hypothetical protein
MACSAQPPSPPSSRAGHESLRASDDNLRDRSRCRPTAPRKSGIAPWRPRCAGTILVATSCRKGIGLLRAPWARSNILALIGIVTTAVGSLAAVIVIPELHDVIFGSAPHDHPVASGLAAPKASDHPFSAEGPDVKFGCEEDNSSSVTYYAPNGMRILNVYAEPINPTIQKKQCKRRFK